MGLGVRDLLHRLLRGLCIHRVRCSLGCSLYILLLLLLLLRQHEHDQRLLGLLLLRLGCWPHSSDGPCYPVSSVCTVSCSASCVVLAPYVGIMNARSTQ